MEDSINHLDLTNNYRTFYPTTTECVFSGTHGIFTKVDHILNHDKVNKFKGFNSCKVGFCEHNGIKFRNQKQKLENPQIFIN